MMNDELKTLCGCGSGDCLQSPEQMKREREREKSNLTISAAPWVERVTASVPDLQEAVPGAGGHGHAVVSDAQAAHAVVMAGQHACGETQHHILNK